MIGWNFPSNGGGQIRGIAEAGIETFTDKKNSSLTRETCKNFLDAAGSFGIGKNAPFTNLRTPQTFSETSRRFSACTGCKSTPRSLKLSLPPTKSKSA